LTGGGHPFVLLQRGREKPGKKKLHLPSKKKEKGGVNQRKGGGGGGKIILKVHARWNRKGGIYAEGRPIIGWREGEERYLKRRKKKKEKETNWWP